MLSGQVMNFDFQSYIQRREADPGRNAVRLQNYAYIEDIEHLRKLSDRDLIQMGISFGLQAWHIAEGYRLRNRSRALGGMKGEDRIAKNWLEVCYYFDHQNLVLNIIPKQKNFFEAYAGSDGAFFGISQAGCGLPNNAQKFVFGRGIGALDNGHVPYLTLGRFFDAMTRGLLGKASQIPDTFLHWRLAADITEDRAGLLACRDLSAAIFSIMRMSLDCESDEIMREIRRYHEKRDVDWGSRDIEKRVRALEAFAGSSLFLPSGGRDINEVDETVRKMYAGY
ncbi:MAG: hypothetical protein II180_08870 [Proteobacteria bacterium]|nr:hypothetical protein [Pseudomonadota bacterium]